MRRLETHDWWPDLVALKDDLSLRELAEKFSVTPGAISAAFKRTGITRRPAPPGPRALRKPRKTSTTELPPELGEEVATTAVDTTENRPGSKDGLLEPHAHLLGQVPDADVARLANVSVRTVQSYRTRNEIPAFNPADAGKQRQSRIDAHASLLGTVPDRTVAEKAGVSINAVRHYRSKRGIPSLQGTDVVSQAAPPAPVAPAPAPAPAAPVALPLETAVGHQAWTVTYRVGADTREGVIVATDLVSAASAASVRVDGQIVSIAWIGLVL